MNITIRNIRDPGNLAQERIVLTVAAASDIGRYLLLAGNFAEGTEVSTRVRYTFWFPDKRANPNDLVVVYTKNGTTNEKVNNNGTKSHFFYWGLDEAIWNAERAAAVLLRVADWEAKFVAD